MRWDIEILVGKVRIAIDEITHDGFEDDFTVDADTEIRQALEHAMNYLLGEVPLEYLTPTELSDVVGDIDSVHEKYIDGSGAILLPADFFRFVCFQLRSWQLPVFDLLDPASDEAKRQATIWGCGSSHKPRVMIVPDNKGHLRLMYWRAGRRSAPVNAEEEKPSPSSPTYYDHVVSSLQYIPHISIPEGTTTVDCGLKDSCEMLLVYRAAGIFLDGKKESELAQRMYALSQTTQTE